MASKPIRNKNAVITSVYGERVNPITGNKEFHRGVDIAVYGNPNCVPIYAVKSGQATYINYNPNGGGGFGKVVYVKCDDGWYSVYPHMDFVSDDYTVGDYIEEGQFIGIMGSTGMSTGRHLHYEERTTLTGGESREPSEVIAMYV